MSPLRVHIQILCSDIERIGRLMNPLGAPALLRPLVPLLCAEYVPLIELPSTQMFPFGHILPLPLSRDECFMPFDDMQIQSAAGDREMFNSVHTILRCAHMVVLPFAIIVSELTSSGRIAFRNPRNSS